MRNQRLAIFAVIAAIGAAGCSSGTSEADGENSTVRVGIIPLIDVAPLYLADDLGYFDDDGIDVDIQTVQTGAAGVAAVASSSLDVAFGAPLPELQAVAKGLPLCEVATAAKLNQGNNQIVSAPGSNIRQPQDLAGKVIAVNALKAANELYDRESLEKAGVDASRTKYLAVPFPDQFSALESGQVDAAHMGEPFLTMAKQAGAQVVVEDPVADALGPQAILSSYFTSKEFADSEGETLAAFESALTKASEYATENPDEVRRIIATYTDLDTATLEKIALPLFSTETDPTTYETTADLMVKYEFLEERPNVDDFLC